MRLNISVSVKLLTEHHLDFLSLKGGCIGSSESTHVKIPHCWKSHVTAQYFYFCETCVGRTMIGKRIFISNKEFA